MRIASQLRTAWQCTFVVCFGMASSSRPVKILHPCVGCLGFDPAEKHHCSKARPLARNVARVALWNHGLGRGGGGAGRAHKGNSTLQAIQRGWVPFQLPHAVDVAAAVACHASSSLRDVQAWAQEKLPRDLDPKGDFLNFPLM